MPYVRLPTCLPVAPSSWAALRPSRPAPCRDATLVVPLHTFGLCCLAVSQLGSRWGSRPLRPALVAVDMAVLRALRALGVTWAAGTGGGEDEPVSPVRLKP